MNPLEKGCSLKKVPTKTLQKVVHLYRQSSEADRIYLRTKFASLDEGMVAVVAELERRGHGPHEDSRSWQVSLDSLFKGRLKD